jgi:hypothetical protein
MAIVTFRRRTSRTFASLDIGPPSEYFCIQGIPVHRTPVQETVQATKNQTKHTSCRRKFRRGKLPTSISNTPSNHRPQLSPTSPVIILWFFLSGPPPDTVKGSVVWLLPIALSTGFAIIYMTARWAVINDEDEPQGELTSTLFQMSPYQQAMLSTIRSGVCAAVMTNLVLDWKRSYWWRFGPT